MYIFIYIGVLLFGMELLATLIAMNFSGLMRPNPRRICKVCGQGGRELIIELIGIGGWRDGIRCGGMCVYV